MAMIYCKECGKEILDKVDKCPNCGCPIPQEQNSYGPIVQVQEAPKKSSLGIMALIFSAIGCTFFVGIILAIIDLCKKDGKKKTLSIIALIISCLWIIIGIAASGSGNTKNTDEVSSPQETFSENEVLEKEEETQEPTKDTPVEESSPEENIPTPIEESSPEENIPSEYKSALNKANSYSDMMYMSKAAIYDQLTSEYGEKFTPEEAQYAIDNVEADWKTNALKKAQSYQETMDMSPAAIHDQLTSDYGEKFTQEEADYAIDNLK